MTDIVPFRGLLYSPARVPDLKPVVAPPYDVISPEKEEEYRRRHPFNIVHLILPKAEGDRDKYAAASATLETWRREGILAMDERASFYVVSQKYLVKGFGEKTRFGLVARVRIEEDDSRTILPHERTMEAPRTDRQELLSATRTQLSQVFMLYSDPEGTVSAAVESVASRPAERWTEDDQGTKADMWRIVDPATIGRIREGLRDRPLIIADGHHRYAAARAYRDAQRAADGSAPGSRSYDYVMSMLTSIDSPGVTIHPYHRAVFSTEELERAAFIRKAREFFDVKEFSFEGIQPRAEQIRRKLREAWRPGRNLYAAYLGGGGYLLLIVRPELDRPQLLGEALVGPLQDLDVTVLHHLLFDRILGIGPEEQRSEEGPLRYTDDIDRAMAWVDADEAQAAILLNPTPKEHLVAVTGAGLQMPHKSTYFYPKVLTGLVLNPLEPLEEASGVPARE